MPVVPPWTGRPDLWQAGIAALKEGPPPGPSAFIHGDFHPGNLLWTGDQLTGIIDWESSSMGPPGEDLAHWRANAAILTGAALDLAYSRGTHNAWWDLAAILEFWDPIRQFANFRAVVPNITLVTIFNRIDSFLGATLEEIE
jgi:aminoglycoside phosphotransferase (APT) family kinase protein